MTDLIATPDSAAATSRWYRFNVWLHRWTSLIATIPFLILCLTGTVLIFHEEIDDALGVVPTATASHRPAADSVAAVRAAHPDERIIGVAVDRKDHPGMMLAFVSPKTAHNFDGTKTLFVNVADANIVGNTDFDKTFTGFLLDLHANWFLGPVGQLFGALIALLVLLSLLSGLVVYLPHVRRVAFGALRRGRGPRLLQLDLHNFIGAVVIGWALVVTTTGLLLGLSTVALGLWQMTEFAEIKTAYAQSAPVDALNPPANVDQVYAAARKAAPQGWEPSTLIFPNTDFSTPRHYAVVVSGAKGLDERLLKLVLIDGADASVARVLELPNYLKAILLSEPLHFGDYGGLALKLLWIACTWLTLFITANGAWLWWDRRRRRRGKHVADVAHGDAA